MSDTPSLALPLIAAGQAQKHVTHNEALATLDTVVQLSVKDRDLTVPPVSPTEGDRHIVAAGATGAWTGQAGKVAVLRGGAWAFHPPAEGWCPWVADEDALLIFDGAAWTDVSAAITALQELTLLGVGTTADATNPLAVKLNKALWTAKTMAEGGDGDLRYTMNKETAADVLSLLLQTGFSGRAEIGLVGDDDFVAKVSPDGSAWTEALRLDKNDGAARFGGNVGIGIAPGATLHLRRAGADICGLQMDGEASVQILLSRYSNDGSQPIQVQQKARGSIASPAAVQTNDIIANLRADGYGSSGFVPGGDIRFIAQAAAPSGADMETRIGFFACPPGSATRSEVLRIDHANGLSMLGANVVIDQNRHHRLRSYTVAGLPSALPAGMLIHCSNLGGGAGALHSDGSNWRRVSAGQQTVASDAAFTLTPLASAEEQRHTGILTANRALTLSTTNAYVGARFRITRTGGGAFTLDVGTGPLKSLATNTWGEFVYDGSAWYLAAHGML